MRKGFAPLVLLVLMVVALAPMAVLAGDRVEVCVFTPPDNGLGIVQELPVAVLDNLPHEYTDDFALVHGPPQPQGGEFPALLPNGNPRECEETLPTKPPPPWTIVP